jgi:hypothetical protein
MDIQPLTPVKAKSPSLWTMFIDGADGSCFSYMRITGFMVITVFLALSAYLSIQSGSLIVPSKEWLYILLTFAAIKPIQKFSEVKEIENQLNYDFQTIQLNDDKKG